MKQWYCRICSLYCCQVPKEENYPIFEFKVEAPTLKDATYKAIEIGETVLEKPQIMQITEVFTQPEAGEIK